MKLFDMKFSKNPIVYLFYPTKRDRIMKDIFYINERMSCENMTEYGFIPIYTFLDIFDKLGWLYTYNSPINFNKDLDQITISKTINKIFINITWSDDTGDDSIVFILKKNPKADTLEIEANIKGTYKYYRVHYDDYISTNYKYNSEDQANICFYYLKLFDAIQKIYLDVLRYLREKTE